MLIVSSRVTSAVSAGGDAALAPGQLGQVEQIGRAVSSRCSGGTWVSSGPITSAMPSSQSFHFGHASASFLENLASCSWVRVGVVLVDGQRAALGKGLVVRAHRMHLVAVALQFSSRTMVGGIRLIT